MKVLQYIEKACSDCKGQISSVRIISMFVVAVIMGTWSIVSIFNGEIQPLGYDIAALVAAVVGAKVYQKRIE